MCGADGGALEASGGCGEENVMLVEIFLLKNGQRWSKNGYEQ
jgi:hypothetical protein